MLCVVERSVGELLVGAAKGDAASWSAIVAEFSGLVWSVARAHRLDAADAADVSQTVWLRLIEHADRIREPERLAGWLSTTTRNECLRVLRRRGRQVPTDLELDTTEDEDVEPLDAALLDSERDRALWRAFRTLSEACQRLLRVLLCDPPLSYQEVSEVMDMPIGSIGATRKRCLERLRRHPEIVRISWAPGASSSQG